ncbi:MAG: alpha-1,2-fucosyltransferase [Lachnospiraceae bacterium]|nr:alpha-1,2-fucosyltransferase [Lachnospiraceae bacterium]
MIIVRFTSGLGNQMYQYNLYRLLKETYPDTPVKADLTWFYAHNDHHGYELEKCFAHDDSAFSIECATYRELFRVTGLIPNMSKGHGRGFEKFRRYPNRILREFTQKKRAPFILDRLQQDVSMETVLHLDPAKDWYLIGFWIESPYWRDRIPSLQKELCFDENYGKKNQELIRSIIESESVSIHVRRGDYLTTYAGQFKALSDDYYKKAVEEIKKVCDTPKFYIFSDDGAFIRREFDWIKDKVIVDHNTGDDSYRDMQLMSLCKHNIIANSTFSAWAAILNRNPEHVTVYPAAYLKDEDSEEIKLKNWIRI